MPLLDHFHAPLHPQRHWESFHTNWAGAIADALNEALPEGYFAEEHTHQGARVEIDVATFQSQESAHQRNSGGSTSTLPVKVWSPIAAAFVLPAAFPDSFEVRIYQSEGGATLVAAVELVSPANKDRAAHMRSFAVKCASYLAQGVSLIVIDIVTSRSGNLHNEMMQLLNHDKKTFLADDQLYAVAYRPIVRDEKEQIDVWPDQLSVGKALPTLPLALNAEICLPIDLEETYTAACLRRRLG
jgi:hypothetical protein